MKIKTISIITYGAFLIGALMMILAIISPFTGFMSIFMYSGLVLGVFGLLFCLMLLRCQSCSGCSDFIIIQRYLPEYCPCCNRKL